MRIERYSSSATCAASLICATRSTRLPSRGCSAQSTSSLLRRKSAERSVGFTFSSGSFARWQTPRERPSRNRPAQSASHRPSHPPSRSPTRAPNSPRRAGETPARAAPQESGRSFATRKSALRRRLRLRRQPAGTLIGLRQRQFADEPLEVEVVRREFLREQVEQLRMRRRIARRDAGRAARRGRGP